MPKTTWSNYKRSGIWVDPPPVFSKFPHFPVFFWQTSLNGWVVTIRSIEEAEVNVHMLFSNFPRSQANLLQKIQKNCSFRSLESLAFLLFGTWHTLTQLTKNRTVQIHLTFCKAPKIIVYHSNVWRWLMTTESAVRMNQNDPKRHKMIKNMPRAVVRYSMTCESIETI